ncbi:hypothetical protein DFA_09598 [Cavenderia fasciculata]|uniref:Uncharacterized protein n=1 Tax=Cavenderia fasciculata TaxID=261658 RepID=F4Q827_CACFS|nr:uncharacterized protein DFA_09598 [Cavenderia fasciculata]EGG15927.1 hypothetical protein DFA_09598 [Cavenderia fasciculata]|eukprot:XP_004352252.1 hypothetical protein DFA_09598 [Cavenderia fasciculata]
MGGHSQTQQGFCNNATYGTNSLYIKCVSLSDGVHVSEILGRPTAPSPQPGTLPSITQFYFPQLTLVSTDGALFVKDPSKNVLDMMVDLPKLGLVIITSDASITNIPQIDNTTSVWKSSSVVPHYFIWKLQ